MPKEIDFQHQIIKAARAQGGYGRKWSSEWQVGVPDLILSLPKFGPLFMEVKLITKVAPGFSRKLDVTLKQAEELKKLEEAGAVAVVGVVVDFSARERYLVVMDRTAERLRHEDMMSDDLVRVPLAVEPMPYGGKVDMERLMARWVKRNLASAA